MCQQQHFTRFRTEQIKTLHSHTNYFQEKLRGSNSSAHTDRSVNTEVCIRSRADETKSGRVSTTARGARSESCAFLRLRVTGTSPRDCQRRPRRPSRHPPDAAHAHALLAVRVAAEADPPTARTFSCRTTHDQPLPQRDSRQRSAEESSVMHCKEKCYTPDWSLTMCNYSSMTCQLQVVISAVK